VPHRDIMTRICAWDKSANAATAKRPEKITFAEMRSARPDRRPSLLYRLSVQPFGQP
jgi:hypothetical protein